MLDWGPVDELTYVIDLNELRQARRALEKVASYQSHIGANSQHERAQAVPAQSRARPLPNLLPAPGTA